MSKEAEYLWKPVRLEDVKELEGFLNHDDKQFNQESERGDAYHLESKAAVYHQEHQIYNLS